MGAHSHVPHQEKVKVTFECSIDERTYLKMLAAKKHMTMSEYILSSLRQEMPRTPNATTIEALMESRESNLQSYKTLEEFWQAMGIDPDA